MNNKILIAVVGLVVVISVIYSFSGGQTEEEYKEEIIEHREENDRFMKSNDESPFSENKAEYKGLNYYEPNLKYKINARFEPVEKQKSMKLITSTGSAKEYLTYGHAAFELNGKQNKLLVLENVEDNELFLAFGDATSADETYGAGRYLDVTHTGGKTIILDFNKAYSPFCAYNDDFTCPFPPKGNLLEVAIKAGEKNYKK